MSSRHGENAGKSQSSLLILVSLVAVFLIAWIISLFLSVSSSKRITEETLFTKIMKYLDYVKAYTRNALILAVHAETKEVASGGGQAGGVGIARSWICNGDVSPAVDDVRFFLSNQTNNDLNKYIMNFGIHDLPTINITNSTCVDYDVSENTVFSGSSDEKFYVGSYGSKANVTLEGNTVSSGNEVYEEIAQDRFWYMYRKFKEWSPTGASIVVGETCGCLSQICACPTSPQTVGGCESCESTCPGFQSCLESIVESARRALADTFDDDYIVCTATLLGCYHELEPCKGVPVCIDWAEAPACRNCYRQEAGGLCSQSLVSERSQQAESLGYYGVNPWQSYSAPRNSVLFADICSEKKCKYWAETRGSMEATFSCTDKKYLLSVVGDRHLTFTVHAMARLKSMNCLYTKQCIQSGSECVCPPGSWCTGCEK